MIQLTKEEYTRVMDYLATKPWAEVNDIVVLLLKKIRELDEKTKKTT